MLMYLQGSSLHKAMNTKYALNFATKQRVSDKPLFIGINVPVKITLPLSLTN